MQSVVMTVNYTYYSNHFEVCKYQLIILYRETSNIYVTYISTIKGKKIKIQDFSN